MVISKKAQQIPSSMTLEVTAKVQKLRSEGKKIVGFTAGEPDFNTPSHIIESCKEGLDKGITKYTQVAGIEALRQEIVDKLYRDNNLVYDKNQIVVCNGAKSCLFHAIYAICDDGDEIILPAPFWFTYEEQVKICGGKPVIVKTLKENGYKITASELEKAITTKTKAVIINSPNNPTGAVYSESELKEIAKVVEEHNLIVISDEIYEKLVYNGNKHVSIASLSNYCKENTIVINGLSKTYSMTGFRIGYLACNLGLAKVISKIQSHTTSNACSFSQYASITALKSPDKVVEDMQKIFNERRIFIMSLLDKLNLEYVTPQGAFYVFVSIENFLNKSIDGKLISSSLDFASYLTDYGVAVIPGKPFHSDGYIRLSYAVSKQDIEEGVRILGEFVKKIK